MFYFYCLPALLLIARAQVTEESPKSTTMSVSDTTTETIKTMGPFSVDIWAIYVPDGIGNAVKVVWGGDKEPNNVNLTYGLYFGKDQDELKHPKVTTSNLNALVQDLEFCTRYDFAVTVLNQNEEIQVNPNTIRTIITGAERLAAPANLTVDLEPRAEPCLDIKWSAPCSTVVTPTGYVVSVLNKKTSKYKVFTLPKTKRSDLIYRLPVEYGDSYEIRISTTFPGSKAVGPLNYTVPQPLQPFKLKVTVNQDDYAFLIYWSEPFVPLSIGRYYYQVFVYPGQDLEAPYEKYYVTRPVMVYKGDIGEYSFCVNLATYDRKHVSQVTAPVYANLNGETYELNATFTETPDR
ncbi:hypothetical protein ABEB36_007342 [Hypothenemus hampei]|uniref:Fibronectin type III domain protein n=1 Tax=Hypothenemus hampei TaxID=57062 RepID=A0ABD1ETM7_HYPHA